MHLLLFVSILPSLQEITPLPLSRVYSPLIVPLYRCQSTMALNWAVGGPVSAPLLLPLLGVFTPPMCPIIAERLQLSDRRFFLWLDFVSLDVRKID